MMYNGSRLLITQPTKELSYKPLEENQRIKAGGSLDLP